MSITWHIQDTRKSHARGHEAVTTLMLVVMTVIRGDMY